MMLPLSYRRPRTFLTALAVIPLISACASTGGGPAPGVKIGAPAQVRLPASKPARSAQFHMMPGLESVIGATARQLTSQFGPARLDVREGDAQKLQFTGTPCILDVYLYPTERANEPLATYVDARRASDGKAVDRAACVAALRAR